MTQIHRFLACATAFFLVVAGPGSAQDTPRVVTVNYPLQYFAERLLSDDAEVVFPVPADVDPSFWRPGVSDISMIQAADLILLNGAGFATWIDRVSLPRSRLVNTSDGFSDQFIVTESITHSHGDGGEHSHEGLASYTWLDPVLAAAQAEAVADAIVARGLADEQDVRDRLDALQAELSTLDAEAESLLSGRGDTGFIATHPRYQYFARRYGLSVSSLEWEAGSDPDATGLEELRQRVSDTGAGVLIWEAEPSADAVRAAGEIGVESAVFETMAHRPAEGDFLDTFRAALSDIRQAAGVSAGN